MTFEPSGRTVAVVDIGDECRRRGLEWIRKTRETIASSKRPPNPFHHSRTDDCEACDGPCLLPRTVKRSA